MLGGEAGLFGVERRVAAMLRVRVECSWWGGGGGILTHICVLGIRLETQHCSASGFSKDFTRFFTCNPQSDTSSFLGAVSLPSLGHRWLPSDLPSPLAPAAI